MSNTAKNNNYIKENNRKGNNKHIKGNNKPGKSIQHGKGKKKEITLKEYRDLVETGIIVPIEGKEMEKIDKKNKDVLALLQVYGDEKKDSEFGALVIMDMRELKTNDDNLIGFCEENQEEDDKFDSPYVGPKLINLKKKEEKDFGYLLALEPLVDKRNAKQGYYNNDPEKKILRGTTVKDFGSLLYVNTKGKPKCIERYRNKGFKSKKTKKPDLLLKALLNDTNKKNALKKYLKSKKGKVDLTDKRTASSKFNKQTSKGINKPTSLLQKAKQLQKQDYRAFSKFCKIPLNDNRCDQKCVKKTRVLPMCNGTLEKKLYSNKKDEYYFKIMSNNNEGVCFSKNKNGIKTALKNRKRIYSQSKNSVDKHKECAFNEQCKNYLKCRKIPARCKLHKTRKVCI